MTKSPKAQARERARAVLHAIRRAFDGSGLSFGVDASDRRVLEVFITASPCPLLDPLHGTGADIPEHLNLDGFHLNEEAASIRARMIAVAKEVLGGDAPLFLTIGFDERLLRGFANALEDARNVAFEPPVLGPRLPRHHIKRWLAENPDLALVRHDSRPDLAKDGMRLVIGRDGRSRFHCRIAPPGGIGAETITHDSKAMSCDGARLSIEESPGRWIVAERK